MSGVDANAHGTAQEVRGRPAAWPGPLRGEVPTPIAENPLRILFVTSAHNSLSQRCYIAVTEMGHDVTVQVVDSPKQIEAAVGAHKPDLVVCPMLKQFIPESVWRKYTGLVARPGPHGDRGPSPLDWAIEFGMEEWGVTVLEAVEEADAGDIWETRKFRMRSVGKSSIYRHEVRRAAVEMLVFAVHNFARGDFKPTRLDYDDPDVTGRPRPLIKQADREIDWRCESTAGVVRKIRAAEGHPGVLDTIAGTNFHMFNVHPERGLRGRPGEIVATRNGAICRATVDGAVWITHLKASDEGWAGTCFQASRHPRARARRHRPGRAGDPGSGPPRSR
jgi:putative two-component system protein, hydrogenase maturation factor HypX/HoxX